MDLVKRYGGKVVSAVSKRTSYLIVGRDPGESKLQKVIQSITELIASLLKFFYVFRLTWNRKNNNGKHKEVISQ